jgi:hypothetical protein
MSVRGITHLMRSHESQRGELINQIFDHFIYCYQCALKIILSKCLWIDVLTRGPASATAAESIRCFVFSVFVFPCFEENCLLIEESNYICCSF